MAKLPSTPKTPNKAAPSAPSGRSAKQERIFPYAEVSKDEAYNVYLLERPRWQLRDKEIGAVKLQKAIAERLGNRYVSCNTLKKWINNGGWGKIMVRAETELKEVLAELLEMAKTGEKVTAHQVNGILGVMLTRFYRASLKIDISTLESMERFLRMMHDTKTLHLRVDGTLDLLKAPSGETENFNVVQLPAPKRAS